MVIVTRILSSKIAGAQRTGGGRRHLWRASTQTFREDVPCRDRATVTAPRVAENGVAFSRRAIKRRGEERVLVLWCEETPQNEERIQEKREARKAF